MQRLSARNKPFRQEFERSRVWAFAGIAARVIGAAMLVADAGAAFVPVIGMVAGIAATGSNASAMSAKVAMPSLRSGS